MPKLYTINYCLYCGVPQRLCKIKLLCDQCWENKEKYGIRSNGITYNYYTEEKKGFIINFE